MRWMTTTLLCSLTACGGGWGGGSMAMEAATAGVTTGGAQDIGLAREQVAAGIVPPPESFVVEGLLSEHDIEVRGPACDRTFCLRPATGVARTLDGEGSAAFTVLGMSSNVDPSRFRRRPQNLAVVLDVSGSMTGDKIAAAREALRRLVRTLDSRDRLAIVLFDDDVDVLVDSTELDQDEIEDVLEAIDDIEADGSTDIESGLAEGYEQVMDHRSADRADRVLLFTDARPNTGRTDEDSFLELADRYADEGVGLSVFGVGLDLGQQLAVSISEVPGANYFFLENAEKLERVFDRDFDLLVTPVAWDFEVIVRPADGYRIVTAYGVPSQAREPDGSLRIHVPTLFLSRNRGAIVIRMEPVAEPEARIAGAVVATSQLSYRTARTGSPHRTALEVRASAPEQVVEEQPGVHQAVTLVNTALGLREASSLAHAGRHADALSLLGRVDELLRQGDFDEERRLVEDLRRLIAEAAPTTS